MLVKNHEDRLHSLGGRFTLRPGINEVPDELWRELKGQSGVKRLLAAKLLTEERAGAQSQQGAGANATTSSETDMGKLDTADALRLVGETVDRALLSKWATQAKDAEVRQAIENQLAAIQLSEEERASALKKRGGK